MALTEMPLSVTVTGADEGGTTRVVIERAEDYHIDRPDETTFNGFEGETIAIYSQTGESAITISNDDLIGHLDDGASYRLIATIQDGLGQSAEIAQDFEVHWTHQALAPTASVSMDNANMVAQLTPTAPTEAANTDVCDIYRLSADRPELIYPDAVFGTTYVDPYPTLGEMGGYRFVLRTANGDYVTLMRHSMRVQISLISARGVCSWNTTPTYRTVGQRISKRRNISAEASKAIGTPP